MWFQVVNTGMSMEDFMKKRKANKMKREKKKSKARKMAKGKKK